MMLRTFTDWLIRKSGLRQPAQWLKEVFDVHPTYAGVDVTPEGAMGSSAAAACVRLLSESVGSLPLFVYRRTEASKLKAPGHALYRVLHDRPNDYQTSYTWRQQAMAHVLLHGNAYSVIERADNNRIVALWPMDPRAVTVDIHGGRVTYSHWAMGERKSFEYSEVLHLKGPTLDGITGMGIVRMARQGIGLDLAMLQHGASLYKNSARPGLVLKSAQWLSEEQRDKMRKWFEGDFSGALNRGKTVVLEGGLELQPVGFSAEDAQFLGSRQFSVQEICRWFRVPPHMIGDPTRLAYASSETEMLAFMQHSLRPWLVNIESEMAVKLFPADGEHFAEFDANAIARGDQASRYDSYSKGLAAGFLTIADVRRWENLPELPDTDRLLRPANMIPASEVPTNV